ncbi:MAG: hypothetical protein JWO05_1910 [Gemmatimonadetes bacterium]|nr:hypothetical protein [Gemmatimonadota bacterium]
MSISEHVQAVVVGAGPAGLATSRELSRRGVRHVVLEQGDAAAHVWSNLYDSLVLHTGRRMSALPGTPFPGDTPVFVPRGQFVRYLQGYAREHAVPMRTSWPVRSVTTAGELWEVASSRGTITCNALVMATGIVSNPRTPTFEGIASFRGRVLHSSQYHRPGDFIGKRVLVVGVGNSGAEIGAELARSGAHVSIAVRSGAHVVPRDLGGVPIQYLSRWVRTLPRAVQERVVALVGALSERRRGVSPIPKPPGSPLDAIPLIGFALVDELRAGRARLVPGITAFTPTGVRFTNGSEDSFDAVILATGFAAALQPLGTLVQLDSKGFAKRRDRVTSADHDRLFFVGHNYDSLGGIWNIALDAPLVAEAIAGAREVGG